MSAGVTFCEPCRERGRKQPAYRIVFGTPMCKFCWRGDPHPGDGPHKLGSPADEAPTQIGCTRGQALNHAPGINYRAVLADLKVRAGEIAAAIAAVERLVS